MKKALSIFALLLIGIATFAQKDTVILVKEPVKLAGSMDQYWETTDMDDISPGDKGARWHLNTDNAGTITFWIDVPPLGLYDLSKNAWKVDDAALVLNIIDGMRCYVVAHPPFSHLRIMEYDKDKWLVHLCTTFGE